MIRNLQTMCESTQKLSSSLKKAHPEIDWEGLAFVRNTLTHDYLYLNLERIWTIVEDDLPKFKVAAAQLLEELDNPNDKKSAENELLDTLSFFCALRVLCCELLNRFGHNIGAENRTRHGRWFR